MNLILIAILSLGAIGAISAIILYLVAQKFKIYEDPRNALVTEVLPGANCGGCGYPGCQGFADACVKSESLEGTVRKSNCRQRTLGCKKGTVRT